MIAERYPSEEWIFVYTDDSQKSEPSGKNFHQQLCCSIKISAQPDICDEGRQSDLTFLSDMDPTGTERFPLLNQTNWSTWKENMRFLQMDRGCWSFIDGCTDQMSKNVTRTIELVSAPLKKKFLSQSVQNCQRICRLSQRICRFLKEMSNTSKNRKLKWSFRQP
ncbi:hypothetical protein CEXT_582081 [Caerostris extrusa]|uniref:Uncharacterized protein n=1 Tax=Caerostris extrusa TaxID=172846 RepID=A0AAV4UMR7_CAEEX|nr:hypothetical protein CEXT_582081 [Caerostris extrusa]